METMSQKDAYEAGEAYMGLMDFLSVPYVLEAQSVETDEGAWVRRVAYPELPGCMAEAQGIEDALASLERQRMRIILDTVRAGGKPPLPRPPLQSCDPFGLAAHLGLQHELEDLLAAEMRRKAGHETAV
jgi:predicted RNase H-like HicB family nuclease